MNEFLTMHKRNRLSSRTDRRTDLSGLITLLESDEELAYAHDVLRDCVLVLSHQEEYHGPPFGFPDALNAAERLISEVGK